MLEVLQRCLQPLGLGLSEWLQRGSMHDVHSELPHLAGVTLSSIDGLPEAWETPQGYQLHLAQGGQQYQLGMLLKGMSAAACRFDTACCFRSF